jgi:hypothetical protein
MGNQTPPKLERYALFSDNVLAAAVILNSTLINAPRYNFCHVSCETTYRVAHKAILNSNFVALTVTHNQMCYQTE